MNFNALKLKKLIATCYATSPVTGNEFQCYIDKNNQLSFAPSANNIPLLQDSGRKPYKVEITEIADENGDGRIDFADVEYLMRNKKNTLTLLDGDGDFRSDECVELLKEADILVTNPPFSLFRDYMALLMKYGKNFLVNGNLNALKYKEILPLFMKDKVWLGCNSGHYWFKVPDNYEEKKTDFKIDENGQKWRRMGNICWYTNLDTERRHEDLTLFRIYSPEKYPKYDNYNAIEVSQTADIPCDYYGVIGVPITFMTKHNPQQFSIVGVLNSHGIILLISPKQIGFPEDYGDQNADEDNTKDAAPPITVLNTIYNTIVAENRGLCEIPLAVCISKSDFFARKLGEGEENGDNIVTIATSDVAPIEDPVTGGTKPGFNATQYNVIQKKIARMMESDPISGALQTQYKYYNYFIFSAVGCDVKKKEKDGKTVSYPVEDPHPIRIVEPLLWLFKRFGYIKADTHIRLPALRGDPNQKVIVKLTGKQKFANLIKPGTYPEVRDLTPEEIKALGYEETL